MVKSFQSLINNFNKLKINKMKKEEQNINPDQFENNDKTDKQEFKAIGVCARCRREMRKLDLNEPCDDLYSFPAYYKVDLMRFACDLADKRLRETFHGEIDIESEDGGYYYTDEAQEEFEIYYNYYYHRIMSWGKLIKSEDFEAEG